MRLFIITSILCLVTTLTTKAQVSLISTDSLIASQSNPSMLVDIPEGDNRVMLVVITNEYINSLDFNVSEVTLDGIALTKLTDVASASLIARNEIEVYYLLDSNITESEEGNLSVSYNLLNTNSLEEIQHHVFFFENIDQNAPFYDVRTNFQLSGNSISASNNMWVDENDFVFSIFNSGNEDLVLSTTGNSSLLKTNNSNSQSNAFGWLSANTTMMVAPGFSSNKIATRMTMASFAMHSNQGAVLPVELLSFNGKVDDFGNATIAWTTASEYNSDYFIIEKLNNCNHWVTIEEVVAAGVSKGFREYSITDVLTESTSFYRLSQVDFDGQKTTYDAISIECHGVDIEENQSISIFPNPASTYAYISGVDVYQEIDILDLNGNLVLQCLPVNPNDCEINVSNLKDGIYVVSQGGKNARLVVSHSISQVR